MIRKYIILVLVTALVIGGIVFSGTIINAAQDVDIYTVKRTDAQSIITASGKLRYSSEKNIKADTYCIVDTLCVNNGDNVKKGDELAVIDAFDFSGELPYSSSDIEKLILALNSGEMGDEMLSMMKQYTVRKTITADRSGRITSVSCNEDQILSKNSTIMKLADPDKLTVAVNINESNIGRIEKGQRARIIFTAIDGKTFSGTVSEIAAEARQTASLMGKETSVEVKIDLDGKDKRLKIGYSAECSIIISTDKNRLVIPYELIKTDEKGSFVFLAENNRAVKQYITTDTEYSDGISVTEGLNEGNSIIKDPSRMYNGKRIITAGEEDNA